MPEGSPVTAIFTAILIPVGAAARPSVWIGCPSEYMCGSIVHRVLSVVWAAGARARPTIVPGLVECFRFTHNQVRIIDAFVLL